MMLSNKALLIYLNISQWSGRKLDKRATESVSNVHLNKLGTGNYTKKLLPGSRELDKINTISSSIRKYFYTQTLPWMSDGARIISSKNYLIFTKDIQKLKQDFNSAVSEFIAVYPDLKSHAKNSLGELYNQGEYPETKELLKKFKCETSFMPLPDVKDFRTEVSESELESFKSKIKEVESKAMLECWSRLSEVVNKASNKLSEPNAVFRDSLIENIKDICSLLPKLNINDDQNLEKSRLEVESLVLGINTNNLRQDSKNRQDAALKLKQIESSMGQFMEGLK
jgi:hypothetical protein